MARSWTSTCAPYPESSRANHPSRARLTFCRRVLRPDEPPTADQNLAVTVLRVPCSRNLAVTVLCVPYSRNLAVTVLCVPYLRNLIVTVLCVPYSRNLTVTVLCVPYSRNLASREILPLLSLRMSCLSAPLGRLGGNSRRHGRDRGVGVPPWRQPRGKWMVSLVNSHTNATAMR